jgi:hypothetical protein
MPFGFLDFAFVAPAWQIALLFCWGWFVSLYLAFRIWWVERRYCPERDKIVEARRNALPLIGLVDIGSNNATLELGKKKRSDDISFDSKYSGIRIDPVLTSVGCEPMRLNGIDVYWYAFENWLPQTVRNHLAFKAISEYKAKYCADLDFLTDIEFVALISTPETHLEHDIGMYISKYFRNVVSEDPVSKKQIVRYVRRTQVEDENTRELTPEGKPIPGTGKVVVKEVEVAPNILIDRIEKIKSDVSQLPISRGWFSMTEAFKNNAYAYSAQDLEMLLIIHDKQGLSELIKKINIMMYAIAAAIVFIGGGMGFYMLQAALKASGKA